MTRDQLEELAKWLDWLLVDPPTDERWAWHAKEYVQEAAALLRSLLAQEPVAWMFVTRDRKHGKRHEFAAIDWVPDPDSSEEFVSKEPLYAVPVPAVDPEWKAEAMRLAEVYATRKYIEGGECGGDWKKTEAARAALAAHLDKK